MLALFSYKTGTITPLSTRSMGGENGIGKGWEQMEKREQGGWSFCVGGPCIYSGPQSLNGQGQKTANLSSHSVKPSSWPYLSLLIASGNAPILWHPKAEEKGVPLLLWEPCVMEQYFRSSSSVYEDEDFQHTKEQAEKECRSHFSSNPERMPPLMFSFPLPCHLNFWN